MYQHKPDFVIDRSGEPAANHAHVILIIAAVTVVGFLGVYYAIFN